MAIKSSPGMISGMQPLNTITGEEFVEVIRLEADGSYKNFRLMVSKIRNNEGLSAYEVAVKNGFVGTETEWLESLKGQGIYQLALQQGFVGTEDEFLASLKGEDGADGAVGKSIYEVAVDNGFTGTEQEFLATLVGKSAYQSALDTGFTGTEAEFIQSLKGDKGDAGEKGDKGDKGDQGDQGKSAYESAVDGGYVGTEEEFNLSLAEPKGVNGGVFITDITPVNAADNVGEKVKSADSFSLVQCSSSTRDVKVKVAAITGHTNYRPVVKVNGVDVSLVAGANAPMWTGEVTINLPEPVGSDPIKVEAVHEDGAKASTDVIMDTAPVVTAATFTGEYPGSQTELKAGDTMSITFTTDQDVVGYEIRDEGAFVARNGTLTAGKTHSLTGLVIADRGNTATNQPFSIRVKKASGSFSAWYKSDVAGTTEKVNVVKLNNLKPTITFGAVTYPAGQTAIKAGEDATVANTVTNATSATYTSANGQLTVTNPTQIEANKTVSYLTGNYNDLTNNLTITAQRAANGSSSTASTIVKIANGAPELTVTTPATRLRSGGNAGTVVQRHTITITSTQSLAEAPVMTAPGGNWDSAGWVGDAAKKVWTRTLLVHDDDAKGIFNFTDVVAKGLAGVTVNTLKAGGEYTLGGFVLRTMSIAAFPNREGAIGTDVVMTGKLRCTNLSKGASGSLNFTYKADDADAVNTYTIKNSNSWYNCDAANAVSNTSGLMRVELEEVV
ncbi:tail assembly protein [Pseudomonas phage vB_PaeM_PS119XW]|uniref:Tail assembly protein n=1 Tax=Pseudomonas phage vB_PaeM_PS119XW TaxID=2601632 RepID=A0A5C1K800_9CAUD|nr:hydrolase [Pseudomonas phage vB_PaeM_PS119XW]QEM41899.1 tail assembly protein [Pseudomonas phage vB_PaeM_PS119XW]